MLQSLGAAEIAAMQSMFDQTWKPITTRDRDYQGVQRLRVVMVQRNTNPMLWQQNALARQDICERMLKTATLGRRSNGLPESFPAAFLSPEELALNVSLQTGFFETNRSINECFLFHGSKPSAVENICNNGFNVGLSGTHAGSLYGSGIYCGENSSKGDEYTDAEESGLYQGLRAMLVCRVVLGQMHYNDEVVPDKDQISRLCSGPEKWFDSVLGDRQKARGTYREFVVFNSAQVFPEYVVLYRRE